MPSITDEAVCIRHWDFSETSQTVSLFCREQGMLRGLAKGAKREKGKFSGGIDLLTRGQIVALIKPTSDLATLTEWDLLETYWPARQSLPAHRAGMFMADMLFRMVTDHDPHPALYDALVAQLGTLGTPAACDAAVLRFEWALLQETGYRPELNHDAETGQPMNLTTNTLAYSARHGGVVADTGAPDRWRVRRETIDCLRELNGTSATDGELPDAAPVTIRRAARLLAFHLRALQNEEPPTMRWVFPDERNEPVSHGT